MLKLIFNIKSKIKSKILRLLDKNFGLIILKKKNLSYFLKSHVNLETQQILKVTEKDNEITRLRNLIENFEQKEIFDEKNFKFLKSRILSTNDYDYDSKTTKLINKNKNFGSTDFVDIAPWLFSSNLSNHKIIHQRFDEASALWRAVKSTSGPILEVGRASGGSTILILAASGKRKVVSVDIKRDVLPHTEEVFRRQDVSKRLEIYVQSSREDIAEKEFGCIFLDADHSYEGISSDIALYWNKLKSFNKANPLIAFHDAALNPVAYVLPVVEACNELIADGSAVVFENWGSMLILEKIKDIDEKKWKNKFFKGYWDQWTNGNKFNHPRKYKKYISNNYKKYLLYKDDLLPNIEQNGVASETWIKEGLLVNHNLNLNADNPMKLLTESNVTSNHKLKTLVKIENIKVCFTIILRPLVLENFKMSIEDENNLCLISCIFKLYPDQSLILDDNKNRFFLDAGYEYGNGLFVCKIYANLETVSKNLYFCLSMLNHNNNDSYLGDDNKVLFINLISIRGIHLN